MGGEIRCVQVSSRGELIAALGTIDTTSTGSASGASGAVYPLREKVGNCRAVVKIIREPAKQNERIVKREVSHLMQVKQFIGWGRLRTDKVDYYYIIMPKMGNRLDMVPFSQERDDQLRKQAKERYLKKNIHIVHE